MLLGNSALDSITLNALFRACVELDVVETGRQLHCFVVKLGFELNCFVVCALVDLYGKFGLAKEARCAFDRVLNRDLVLWNVMLSCYALNRLPEEAFLVFSSMRGEDLRPDRIAFLGILSACSHAGLVNEGIHYFNLMVNQYQLIPGREHYSCLVDLLGRAGFLDDAFKVLTSIPFQHGSDTWGAFLGACSTHGNLRLAKSAAEMLFKLEPTDPASYALMSNMYASGGQWTDVARLRKLLKDKCDHKLPGCSWTEPS
ncbi:Pentatricopeptide repeat-containing protein At4g02750 [Linum perenne]